MRLARYSDSVCVCVYVCVSVPVGLVPQSTHRLRDDKSLDRSQNEQCLNLYLISPNPTKTSDKAEVKFDVKWSRKKK
jgi:hypothetical protein